jgi:hypothetical protein
MANKRLISKTISYSKQVSSLNEFAQLLFTWIIPHLDNYGRIDGDSEVLKAKVMPMGKRSPEDFENAIQEMINAILIERYTADEKLIIQYLNFEKYQKDLKKRTKSKYPENPRNSNNLREIQGNSSINKENSTVGIVPEEVPNNQVESEIINTENNPNTNLVDGQS